MIYPQIFEQKIEFDKVRDLLKRHCLSPLGKEKVDEMHFSDDYSIVQTWLHQADEFVRIINEEDNFPANHFYDVRDALKQLKVIGSWIDQHVLSELNKSLKTINGIVAFFMDEEKSQTYPHLAELSADIFVSSEISKNIERIIDEHGQIRDTASPELSNIRREMTAAMNSVSRILNTVMRRAQADGIVDSDISPSMRDGRLVIPVNPSYKRRIKGIVHDESASGKTVYIEPAEVVEANNRIRELENDERREIIRILSAFTDFLRPHIPDLLESYNYLAQIDFIRAKAKFAEQINAIRPTLKDELIIDWVHAIHPLLYLALQKQGRKVVPLEITLKDENRILVISGPNAGGKSVCLKTVGLLQYMVQSGLMIPMRENSTVGIFKDIFIDIGDEQSIENDLSTYSSHLQNMKFFVRNCNENSLLLIDEFGSGTEPQIGAAIAESLLERFNRRKSFGVITTHYQNLKHYANENEGVINGAMLYDRHRMEPLFQLSIGNPGSSFAVEIARKIGLPEDVIEQASEIVGSDYVNMDKYLQDITRDKRYWARRREEIRRERRRLERTIERYEADQESLNKQKREIINEAKQEAQKILDESNARIEGTIRKIRETQADKEKTQKVRQSLQKYREEMTREERAERRKMQKEKRQRQNKKQTSPTLQVGDAVKMKGQTAVGEIIELQSKKATVAFGVIKTTVNIDTLERANRKDIRSNESKSQSSMTRDLMHERQLNFKQDIDVRGMRGDEALQAVIYFVDDALQLGITRIRVLHGTGTGALRQIIRDYLRTVQGVNSFKDEHVQFGGAGITVIDLD